MFQVHITVSLKLQTLTYLFPVRISSMDTDVNVSWFFPPPQPNKKPFFFLYRRSIDAMSGNLVAKTTIWV